MKILGLDLGVGSIGWALIETDDEKNPLAIIGMGCRIVRLSPDESNNFDKGSGESVCSQRTAMRTARKTNFRFKMRRDQLHNKLIQYGILTDDSSTTVIPPLELWGLRAAAAEKQVSLPELGRVLMHICQKRGYKHAKSDMSDSKETEYVANVNANYKSIQEKGLTIGENFYAELLASEKHSAKGKHSVSFRIKDIVFPRKAYEEEFDRIMNVQSQYYPDILTPEIIADLKNTIFYQRPLKSCKHLVNICEFEKRNFLNKEGKPVEVGPKVAPRTSPLAQICKIWETVNNIRLENPHNRGKKKTLPPSLFDEASSVPRDARLLCEEYTLTPEEKQKVFEFLNTHEKMSATDLLKILGLKKSDGFKPDKAVGKGLQGNTTFMALKNALGDFEDAEKLLQFDIDIDRVDSVDTETGEMFEKLVVNPDYINQPLYKLWHVVYSISDRDELTKVIHDKYGIDNPEIIDRLYAIDFVKPGFSNKSAKFMRRILPYLIDGMDYSEACAAAGVKHSDSMTSEEIESRSLQSHLENLKKNELRQPIVEKILNQMINVVNELIDEYGEIDEVRIELARQLKQNKQQRAETSKQLGKREKENKMIEEKIAELGIRPSRNRIQKYRLWQETGNVCIYCGQPIAASEFLEGNGAEIEHIIPRSIFFDDSYSNRACSCRECNRAKGKMTGYDFMNAKSEEDFTKYLKRVEEMYSSHVISKTKRDRLLTPSTEIPADFLNRDLTLSQYISRKAHEILKNVIRHVWVSSGSVTDFFRHAWGYDEILHNLNIDRYALADKVEEVEFEHNGQTHKELRIKEWSKRLDHRHHAIDALTVALTQQGFIQRLNNLNTQRDFMHSDIVEQGDDFKERHSLLKQWAATRKHFPVSEVTKTVSGIAISIKPGKKVTTSGKRYIYRNGKRKLAQAGIQIPRGSLHQESIYGCIKMPTATVPLKKAFEEPENIFNSKIREAVIKRLAECGGDVKKATKTLAKNPIVIPGWPEQSAQVGKVKMFRDCFVIKYDVASLKYKDLSSIVDSGVRRIIAKRFEECGNDDKKFQKSISENPIVIPSSGNQIRTVRCFTGLNPDKLVAVRKDSTGNTIGYAKTGSNNHVAFYTKEDGGIDTRVVSTWIATKRKLYGLPVVITDVKAAWDKLASLPENDDVREIAASLPDMNSSYLFDMKMGEMFVLGMSDEEFNDAVTANDTAALCANLYRVQKLAAGDYYFRRHTETTLGKDENEDKAMKALCRAQSYNALISLNPRKVKVSVTGKISFL